MKIHRFVDMFRCCLFCLLFMLAGDLWAEDVTITIDVSSLSGTDGNYTWNSGGVSGVAKCKIEYSEYMAFTVSGTSSNYKIYNSSGVPGKIKSIVIECQSKSYPNWNLYVSNEEVHSLEEDMKVSSSSTSRWDCDESHQMAFFYLDLYGGSCWIKSFKITYEPTPQPLTLVAQQNDTYYATFSNTQPTFFPSADGVKIMTAYVDGGKLNTPKINNDEGGVYVPANTGVLISSTSPTVNYLYSNNKEGKTVGTNMLHPATEEMSGNNLFYKLAYDDFTNKTGLGFYWGAANGAAFDRKAGTAYLAVPKSSGAKGFHFDFDGETSVEALERSDSNVPVYNLQGQKVTDEYRGVYIRSGKKYFKK